MTLQNQKYLSEKQNLLTQPLDQNNELIDKLRYEFPFLDIESGPWIAGGAARRLYSKEISNYPDIDIFCPNKKIYDFIIKDRKLLNTSKNGAYFLINETIKINLISHEFHETVESLFSTFDLTVCCFATDCDTIAFTPDAAEDVENKVLRTTNKPTTLRRLSRYLEYGFLPKGNMFNVR